jgi:predicted amidohydrolase
MKVAANGINHEMMKLKMDIAMSIYPSIDMIVFSELSAYGPLTYFAQEFPGVYEEEMKALAKKHKVWLIPGSAFEKADDKIYNTALVIDPEGVVQKRYRKMFPFYPYEEGVAAGHEYCIFDIPKVGRFGLSICYDMWFPETTRTLTVMGAEVIIHPTMTGTMDRDIEHSIVQTMAAVNQCFFFDINGLDSGGIGRSTVCGPDGRIIYQAGATEEIFPVEIDMERVKRSRELGVMRLGQPMKSFRDHMGDFKVYDKSTELPYLDSLGPLIKPNKLSDLAEAMQKESAVQYPINTVR